MSDNILFKDANNLTVTHASAQDASLVQHPAALAEIMVGAVPTRVGNGVSVPVASTNATGSMVDLGSQADAAATTDAGSFSLIALVKRLLGKMPGLGQAASAASQPVVIASDQSVIPCGGNTVTKTGLPVVTAASAYASGNTLGAIISILNATRLGAGSGVIQAITLNCKSVQSFNYDLLFLTSTPGSSTVTDKTALAINVLDFDKVIGTVSSGSWVNLGTPSVSQYTSINLPFNLPSGTTLYCILVARGTPTFTATTDLSLTVRILQD